MAIKMRVSKERESAICVSCNKGFKVSLEMYDVMIGNVLVVLCDRCMEEMLRKCCSASCKYNSRLKSPKEITKAGIVERYRAGHR